MTNPGEPMSAHGTHAGTSAEPSERFLRACRGLPTDTTPIWLMRQAGRYMAEYRAIRAKYSMLEMLKNAEVAAEVTLQPIDKFGFDAAIIFSDILPPLMGMGLDIEFVEGFGPRIKGAVWRRDEISNLETPPAAESMPATLEAIGIVVEELAPRGIPLIGFAGAPFTLASYAVEGGGSKTYAKVKGLMYSDAAAWDILMNKLVGVQTEYMLAQVSAGVSALQLFDSWAGLALSSEDYVRFVKPYNTRLFAGLEGAGVPVINFSTGTSSYLEEVAACGGDVIGVDWRMPLDWSWKKIGFDRPIQGNLDPVALLTPWSELEKRATDVLDRAGGRPGHIFNLGHGIFPETPVDNVRRLVDFVRERTRR